MSLFGKIKTAVMGNPVTREYELGKHVASAGPGLLWKVHSGVKKTTRQEVSIFVLDKKVPELEKLPKKQREAIYEMLKKGPTHLIKLRHPRLMTVEHQVMESGDTLAFVSEPIFASLANLLGHYENMPSPLPLVIKEHRLHPIEIQHGLMQVAEGLNFLHSDVKMMHGNLTPQNIVVTSNGNWKVMGFSFCCYSQYQSEAQTSFAFRDWDTRKPLHTNPSLDYLAPEYILSKSCGTSSDVFSYGMLTFSAYNGGRPLFENNNNMLSFKRNVEQVSRIAESALGEIPSEFKQQVRGMLAVEPSVRPDALQITKDPFFDEVAVSTLKYLDSLYEKKDIDKSQFFKKNLARVITKLPKRIVHQRVLPPLSVEFRNHKMVPFVLPLVLLVAEDCTLHEYSDLVLPILAPAMKIQDPIQVPLIFLQKMDLLLKMTSQDDVQKHVLPMITKSLEAENSQVQELCVNILPSFAGMVDYSSMKYSIVPRITALCIGAKGTSLCVKCLVCLGQMLDILDKHMVWNQVLPILHQITSREPGVLMAMLGIFHQTLTKPKLGLEKKILAETIIPFLIPLSIEPTLNLKQFNQFMKVIREMLARVETEQQAHLDQLSKMDEQTKSTVVFAREVAETKAMDDAINRLEGMFAGTDKEEPMAPRKGDNTARTSSFGPSSENSNFLSNVNLSDLSTTFSSNSSSTKTSAAAATTAPPMSTLTPGKPTQGKLAGETLQPTKPGYQPPLSVLQPQQQQQQSSLADSSFFNNTPNSTSSSSNLISGSNWSTGILTPDPSLAQTTNVPPPSDVGGANAGIFSGVAANPGQSQPSSNSGGVFAGMNVKRSPNLAAGRSANDGMFGGNRSPNLTAGKSANDGMFGGMNVNQSPNLAMRSSQPLVPQGSSNVAKSSSTSGGWSSSIQGAGGGGLGGQVGTGMGQAWNATGAPQRSGEMQGQQNQSGWLGGMQSQQNPSVWSDGAQSQSRQSSGLQVQSGWSSGLQSTSQQGQRQSSGWSSGNIPVSKSAESNWSQNLGQQVNTSGMGMNQLGMPSSGMGMSHGGNSQPHMNYGSNNNNMGIGANQQGSPGMGMRPNQQGSGQSQNQQTGMNWGSGIQPQQNLGAQPLIAVPNAGSQGGSTNSNKPTPGANPFADMSFLS